MISVTNLAKNFGPQTLFENVSFQLTPGNRYGLVGANGSGKSTFLKMLIGTELASAGEINMPRRLRIGVLKQDHFAYEEVPIVDVVMMGHEELWQAMVEKEDVLAKAEDHFDADRYSELEDIIIRHDGYTLEARAGEILEGLGITSDQHKNPMSTLSGGFKLRVLLAQTLAATPDALLLDEPTNHLDILSIRWLERFLVDFPGLVVVISHDHRFLDNVSNHIIDVDYETINLYVGNYQQFVKGKTEERERREAEIAKREREIAHHKDFIDRFKAKATKARQAQSKMKQMEKIIIEPLPQTSRRYPTFRFQQTRPSGRIALEVQGIKKAYGDKQVLHGVDLVVERGDRLAIIGPNGIGKSTLLKIAMGNVEADAGTAEWGYEAHPGYFAQDHHESLGTGKGTVESWLWDFCPGEQIGFVRGKLGMVLFSGDEVEKKLSSLSGGEATRLVFAKLGIAKPNILVLDEPTNHLDIEAIEALVAGLRDFDGTLIFVSHDRWFVSQLADRIIEISADGINDYRGTYDEYVERCGDDHLDVETAVLRAKRDKKKRSKGEDAPKNSADEAARKKRLKAAKKERDEVTADIEKAEARVDAINEMFCNPGFFDDNDPKEIRRLETEQKTLETRIQELMETWENLETELAELADVA